jgi:hypothetical protein
MNSRGEALATDVLDPEVLGTVDCLHVFGDEPLRKVQELIEVAGASQARVLDVGTRATAARQDCWRIARVATWRRWNCSQI